MRTAREIDTACRACQQRVGCDFLAGFCKLSISEIVTHRRDLLNTETAQMRWRAKNLDHCREYDKQRYQENRESEIARQTKFQRDHPESRARAQKRYAAKHRDKINAQRRERRKARSQGALATGGVTVPPPPVFFTS